MVQLEAGPTDPPPAGAVAARRREILGAASRIFRRRGFAATGMREVAAELGMTAGSLYHYFDGKDDLLAYCQETTLDLLLAGASEAAVPDAKPIVARLRRLIVAHIVCLNETLPGSLAHLEIESLPEPSRKRLAPKRERYERLFSETIAAGVASGEFAARDPRLATLALLGALNWTVKWFSDEGEQTAAEVGHEFAELFLAGLARSPDA